MWFALWTYGHVPFLLRRSSNLWTWWKVHIGTTKLFPWCRLHEKKQIYGKINCYIYSKCWVTFQHIHLRNWDICLPVWTIFVSCIVEICRLELEPLWHSSPTLCHSGNAEADRTGISWGVRKMEITESEVRTIGWMMIKHLPAELLQEMCLP